MSLVDFRKYLVEQSQERYKPFVIFAPAVGRKTWFAEKVKARFDHEFGVCIHDLQREFLHDPKLSAAISTFSPEEFRSYILGIECVEKVVLFDNCDFLINTWDDVEKERFARIIEGGIKAEDSPKVLVFFLQPDPIITSKPLPNSKQNPRILPLASFADF